MRAVTVEYHAGARFDDLLEIFVRVERIGTTSITYDHAAYRIDEDGDDTLMATAKATLVSIALDERRAVAVPDAFRDRIASFEAAAATTST
jgi:acyl-CoA thioesterase FadM